MGERCPDHDRCFDALNSRLDKMDVSLADIRLELTDIRLQLEKGAGIFELHRHKLGQHERFVYAVIAIICGSVGAALMGLVIKIAQ